MAHRLVAEAFIPNYKNKRFVNNKDGVKTNNDVNNLEWCTTTENNRHARETNLNPRISGVCHHVTKYKYILFKDGEFFAEMFGQSDFPKYGFNRESIRRYASGQMGDKTYKGFTLKREIISSEDKLRLMKESGNLRNSRRKKYN
jgi:hypothetical protein